MRVAALIALIAALITTAPGCKKGAKPVQASVDDAAPIVTKNEAGVAVAPPPLPTLPLGLPPLPRRAAAITAELVEQGRLLFSDPNVWGGNSCASCHRPAHNFAGELALDRTAVGRTNLRHTPALINLVYSRRFTWDGRATSIEAMLPGHIRGQLGAQLADPQDAVALSGYVLTRYDGGAAWDRHERGEPEAVSTAAIAGATVFNERAGCAVCHPPPLYSDLSVHSSSVGVGIGPPDPAKRFKTPTLRAISRTGPYFHAGTSATLEAALEVELARTDSALTPIESANLLAFLRTL